MPRPHPVLVELAAGRAPTWTTDADDGLLASALDHGMHGLLWSWVRDQAPGYSERATLAGVDVATRQRHDRLWETLVKVHGTLAEMGIDIAVIKGVTAEARWYARPGERPCTDVDVLLDPARSGQAAEILDVLQPGHPLRGQIVELVRSNFMQSVNVRVDHVPVDLHFDLLKLGIPTRQRDLVWARMLDHPLPDRTTVRVPDAETALITFLVHINKDSFPVLLGFADIARILRDEPLDWEFIHHFLRDEGLDVVGACSLTMVTEALGLPTPKLRPPGGPRTRVWNAVWPERTTLLGRVGANRSRRQDLIPFLARGRNADAVRWVGRITFPRPATVALRYPNIPGPYLWRLTKGRLQTARARNIELRARRAPSAAANGPAPSRESAAIARLLHTRAQSEPLWLEVRGESMGWSIRSGTRVRIEPATRPARGEVWAFSDAQGQIVVHRYRGAARSGHRFQGDARVRADNAVDGEHLIGRVTELDPPRPPVQWGSFAGAVQRVPRVAVATATRTMRRTRARARR